MTAETPVLDTLADMNTVSIQHNSLAPREALLARIAALIAVAPVVGTAKVVSAGGKILRSLGLAITVADFDMTDDMNAPL